MIGGSHHLHLLRNTTAGKTHLIDVSVLVDLYDQPLGQGVDHRCAHAVESAGNFIASAAEFSAGMQHREHDFKRRTAGLCLNVHGNTAAIIYHGNGSVGINLHQNFRAIPCQRFVDGVIYDLIHQMVQTGRRRGPDIHAGPLTNRLQPLQNLNF